MHALETKALGQSREQIKLRQLDREAEASRLIYETMLNRLKETSEQVELQAADARILSPADAPLTPELERKQLILALAAAFGLLGGVGLVFLRDQLDASFRSPKQIEALTGYTVLATIPGIRSPPPRPPRRRPAAPRAPELVAWRNWSATSAPACSTPAAPTRRRCCSSPPRFPARARPPRPC